MMTPEAASQVRVLCHSGYTYAERPVEIRLDGKRYRVAQILAEGRSPEGKWFRVLTHSGQALTLTYHEDKDSWYASGLEATE